MKRDFLSDEERTLLSNYEPKDKSRADRIERHASEYSDYNPTYDDYFKAYLREKEDGRIKGMVESVLSARERLGGSEWENYKKDMRCRVVEGFMDEEILSVIRYVEENIGDTPAGEKNPDPTQQTGTGVRL